MRGDKWLRHEVRSWNLILPGMRPFMTVWPPTRMFTSVAVPTTVWLAWRSRTSWPALSPQKARCSTSAAAPASMHCTTRSRGIASWLTITHPAWWRSWKRAAGRSSLRGAVRAYAAEYPSFLDRFLPWPAPHAVVSNFAVLNSIRDLSPLFETFGRQLAPPGWVIVSILNPLHWAKVKMPNWWRGAWRGPTRTRLFSKEPYATYLTFSSYRQYLHMNAMRPGK